MGMPASNLGVSQRVSVHGHGGNFKVHHQSWTSEDLASLCGSQANQDRLSFYRSPLEAMLSRVPKAAVRLVAPFERDHHGSWNASRKDFVSLRSERQSLVSI
jgi:hypothetical protein